MWIEIDESTKGLWDFICSSFSLAPAAFFACLCAALLLMPHPIHLFSFPNTLPCSSTFVKSLFESSTASVHKVYEFATIYL